MSHYSCICIHIHIVILFSFQSPRYTSQQTPSLLTVEVYLYLFLYLNFYLYVCMFSVHFPTNSITLDSSTKNCEKLKCQKGGTWAVVRSRGCTRGNTFKVIEALDSVPKNLQNRDYFKREKWVKENSPERAGCQLDGQYFLGNHSKIILKETN